MGYYEPYKPYEIKPIPKKLVEKIEPYFVLKIVVIACSCGTVDKYEERFTKEQFEEEAIDLYHELFDYSYGNKVQNKFITFVEKHRKELDFAMSVYNNFDESYYEDQSYNFYDTESIDAFHLNKDNCELDSVDAFYIDEEGNEHEIDVNDEWYEGCEQDNDWICDKVCTGCDNYLYCADELDYSTYRTKVRVKPDDFYSANDMENPDINEITMQSKGEK